MLTWMDLLIEVRARSRHWSYSIAALDG